MVSTSSRLLELLALLQGRHSRGAAELSERLGVSTRTIRRDIERLRGLGYGIESATGPGGAYRLRSGAEITPLIFDDDEAVALAVVLRAGAAGSDGPIEAACDRALAKVEQVLPQRLRHEVVTLQAMTVTVASAPHGIEPSVIAAIASACDEHLIIRFAYVDRDGVGSDRRVEPLRLVARGRRWYVVGYDLDRRDWRTFRVDRLRLAPHPGHRFTPRPIPGGDIAAFVAERIARPPEHWITVRFRSPVEHLAGWMGSGDRSVESAESAESVESAEDAEGADRVATIEGHDPLMVVATLLMADADFEVIAADDAVADALAVVRRRLHGSVAVAPEPSGDP